MTRPAHMQKDEMASTQAAPDTDSSTNNGCNTFKFNSSGYDKLTSKILEICASVISHPLSFICNHSIYKGIFRDRLKIAAVKSLCKKGDKVNMTNYRCMSLLIVFFIKYSRKLCTSG
jgi:hypothetical protein